MINEFGRGIIQAMPKLKYKHLWNFAEEIEPASSDYPDYNGALCEIGLMLCKKPKYSLGPVPANCAVFADTGGDGVCFSFLTINGKANHKSPVIMTVPISWPSQIVVGENLFEFLCLGSRFGFFCLEGLSHYPKKLIKAYNDQEQQLYFSEPFGNELKLLKRLRKKFSLKPWTNIDKRLKELKKSYLSKLDRVEY